MDHKLYRSVIDELVEECREGQGAVIPKRVRSGRYHPDPIETLSPDLQVLCRFVKSLSTAQRAVLASMLENAFSGGVFNTLRVLEDNEIEPFLEGYEGSPYEDFIGRLHDWEWPEE